MLVGSERGVANRIFCGAAPDFPTNGKRAYTMDTDRRVPPMSSLIWPDADMQAWAGLAQLRSDFEFSDDHCALAAHAIHFDIS